MTRREVIALIAGATAAWPLAARAEAIRRVGLLFINSAQGTATLGLVETLIQGLKERGWIEGQNITFERRFADGEQNALPNLAAELMRPIEQPDRIDLVVNLKTAKALGLTIPPTLLVRADKVIE